MTTATITPTRPTAPDCVKLLAALEKARRCEPDGWLRDAYHLNVMVHSRVSDLRRLGWNVDMKRFGPKDYRYRLVDPHPPTDADGQTRLEVA